MSNLQIVADSPAADLLRMALSYSDTHNVEIIADAFGVAAKLTPRDPDGPQYRVSPYVDNYPNGRRRYRSGMLTRQHRVDASA